MTGLTSTLPTFYRGHRRLYSVVRSTFRLSTLTVSSSGLFMDPGTLVLTCVLDCGHR